MNQNRFWQRTIVFMTAVSVAALFVAGCGRSQKLESLEYQNRILTERVAELEEQLTQADAAAAMGEQSFAGGSVYIVVEGDNLWNIAKKKLGSGTRYKEILALNPHISKDEPLTIGTKLLLPKSN